MSENQLTDEELREIRANLKQSGEQSKIAAESMRDFAGAATDLAKAAGALQLSVTSSQEEALKTMVNHIKRSNRTRRAVEDRMRQLDEGLPPRAQVEIDGSSRTP